MDGWMNGRHCLPPTLILPFQTTFSLTPHPPTQSLWYFLSYYSHSFTHSLSQLYSLSLALFHPLSPSTSTGNQNENKSHVKKWMKSKWKKERNAKNINGDVVYSPRVPSNTHDIVFVPSWQTFPHTYEIIFCLFWLENTRIPLNA